MSEELKFASEDQAFQYLSEITGKRVLIAKTLEQLMPELIERVKKRDVKDFGSDEDVQKKIIEIAELDPKFEGNLKKPSKPIHALLEWYLKNPTKMERFIGDQEFKNDIKKFNIYRGQGKTKKSLKDFDSPSDFINHLIGLEHDIKSDLAVNKRKQFLKSPYKNKNGVNAYYIGSDDSWEDLGEYLFEAQTKWCVNEESNYDSYVPLWLFTHRTSYFALFSPGSNMFMGPSNEELTGEEVEELMPLLEDLNLVDEFENSDSGEAYRDQDPPYDDEHEYARSAWDSWADHDFTIELGREFDDKLEILSEEMGAKEVFEISDIPDKDLWELFQEVSQKNEIYWEWEGGRGDWSVAIDTRAVANLVKWEDINFFFMDDIEKKIVQDVMLDKGELEKISKDGQENLRKKYPTYFKKLAEQYGQKTLFSSVNEALQYLADITGKSIKIASKD